MPSIARSLASLFVAQVGLAGAAHAACETPVDSLALEQAVSTAHAAFQSMDGAELQRQREALLEALPCADRALPPSLAAGVHSVDALVAFVLEDDARVVNSLRSALRADPAFTLDPILPSSDHPLHARLEAARGLGAGAEQPLREAADTRFIVDGHVRAEAPADRPTVLQQQQQEGLVVATVYLSARAPLPDWASPTPGPVGPTTAGEAAALPADSSPRGRRPWALVAATGATAAAAGGLYALAASKHGTFMDPTTPYADLEGLRTQANTFTWTAVGLGVASLGLGTAVAVTW
ncbi:MAG: hypothetical protein H6742_15220 [Alphaproteobacteria bacterium]|nr:hypothetical protein [Alphaproteobacteria bacterium]